MTLYRVVPQQSPVEIEGKSTVHGVHARSQALSGVLEVTLGENGWPRLDAPYSAKLTLPVESIRSDSSLQDREMYRRLDVRRHPNVEVEVVKAEALDSPGRYRATARVTVAGTTRELTGDVALSVEDGRLVVQGEQELDIRDFGIEPPRLLLLKVDPHVRVKVQVTAVPQN